MYLVVLLLSVVPALAAPQAPPADCATRDTCRAQALIAEAAGDFERFHDLAWRAVQKGKPNDPELMVMLARAMALSGRPGDAIVMLSRLADMGVKVDTSGDEFRVVRTLKDWPDVESKLAGLAGPAITDATPSGGGQLSAGSGQRPAAGGQLPAGSSQLPGGSSQLPGGSGQIPAGSGKQLATSGKLAAAARLESGVGAEPRANSEANSPLTAEAGTPEPEFSFDAPPLATSGLAYDAVSRRWLMSDPSTAGLLVVDEISHRVVPLVSGAGAGFYSDLTAFRIDEKRGDLWVASARQDGDHVASVLHKLQLVSGRPIFEVQSASFGDVRLVDVAVDQSGTVYALDAAGARIFRVRPGSRTFEVVTALGIAAPAAFDVVGDRFAYVAGSAGVARVDLETARASLLKSEPPLEGVSAVDARGRALFLLQQTSDGERLIRCTLNKTGQKIASIRVVDAATAMARAGGKLYYVSSPGLIKAVRDRP